MSLEIIVPYGITLSGNPVWITFIGEPAPELATDYKFMLKIESTNNVLIGAPFYEAVAPDTDNRAILNIQGYIDRIVKYSFSYPPASACVQYENPVHEITITAGIRYVDSNGVLVETWNVTGSTLQLLKGGVSQRQLNNWREYSQTFFSVYIESGKFLTQRPQDDFCHTYQPVKLWNYNIEDRPVNTLRLISYYSDNTNTTTNIAITQTKNNLYELNVNPYHNGIALVKENGAKLLNWSAALYNTNTLRSDVRRFQYDLRYIERPFWLLFANSLGGIDDVYLSGFAVEEFESNDETVYRPAPYDATKFDRTLLPSSKQGQNTWKINTGPKSATQMFHLRDLLVSREVWLIYPSNFVTAYTIIPVNIKNTSSEIVDRKEDQYNLTIEMVEAHTSQFNFDNRLIS
jgi:hypothetical protein